MISRPAVVLVELISWETRARNFSPLVDGPLGVEDPQPITSRVVGNANTKRLRALLKPGTPRACRIKAFMRNRDYNKARRRAFSLSGWMRLSAILYPQVNARRPEKKAEKISRPL